MAEFMAEKGGQLEGVTDFSGATVSLAENSIFSSKLQWAIIDGDCDALSSRNWNKVQVSYYNVFLNTYFSFRSSSTRSHSPGYLALVVRSYVNLRGICWMPGAVYPRQPSPTLKPGPRPSVQNSRSSP